MGNSFLVTTAIPDPGFQLLADAGRVTVLPEPPDYETLAALCASGEFDVVLTQLRDVIDAPLLAGARLRGVSNFAVGYNNIDVDAATRAGIMVGNTPGVLTDATADIAMLLILGTARRVVEGDQLVRSGRFHGWEPELLLGRDAPVPCWVRRVLAGSPVLRQGALSASAWTCSSHRGRRPTARQRRGTRRVRGQESARCRGRNSSNAATSCPCTCRSRIRPDTSWTRTCCTA